MTKDEFKEFSEKMLDCEAHVCDAEMDGGSLSVRMHGKVNKIVALATQAIITATQRQSEPLRMRLLLKTASAILDAAAEDAITPTEPEKEKRSEQQQLH